MPYIRIELSKEMHKELRIMALQDDTTLQNLVPVLIGAGLVHHKQSAQVAKTDNEKPVHIKSTKSTKGTKGTKIAVVVPLISATTPAVGAISD